MARLFPYSAQPYIRLDDGEWVPDESREAKDSYTIIWEDGELWMEAHRYLHEKKGKPSTILSIAKDLKAYADWLEENNLHWLHFPMREEDRCLHRFRGHLIKNRGTSSVPSRRMGRVVNFYKWAKTRKLIDKQIEMWEDQQVAVSFFSPTGFRRTAGIWTTDLRIPHRKKNISTVEDGLLPLLPEDRDALLEYLSSNPTEMNTVLHAMFVLGFFTGTRKGSIRSLRIENLKNATPDPQDPNNILLVAAGPGTGIDTKFDVSGYLRFLQPVHKFILDYAEKNITRLERQAKASTENKSLVFLTRDGKPYSDGSLNTAMCDLRKSLVETGLTQFHDLKFHQSRATCGTELARLHMENSDAEAIEVVKDWLMHKDASTTWTYIKFLKQSKAARKANTAFNQQFLGPHFSQRIVAA